MNHRDANDWKHTTGTDPYAETAGVDLFDDELNAAGEPTVSIYLRAADGTRRPARTITPGTPYFDSVLQAWMEKGTVNDYRTRTTAPRADGQQA